MVCDAKNHEFVFAEGFDSSEGFGEEGSDSQSEELFEELKSEDGQQEVVLFSIFSSYKFAEFFF